MVRSDSEDDTQDNSPDELAYDRALEAYTNAMHEARRQFMAAIAPLEVEPRPVKTTPANVSVVNEELKKVEEAVRTLSQAFPHQDTLINISVIINEKRHIHGMRSLFGISVGQASP